jgi:Zn-finger nucleic acid-binding protein
MTTSLNCPTCGAAAGADATQCDYCGSVLAVMACPACFGTMFVGMQFCPSCGAKGSRELLEETTRRACPGCRAPMQYVRVGTTAIHECSSCASTWLSATVFTALCMNREEHGQTMLLIGARSADATLAVNRPPGVTRYVPCPECTKLMNRSNFGHRSGVIIDVCKGHGAWFERGELSRVLTFVEDGGLERARIEEQEKQAEAKRALEREMREVSRLSASAGGHALFSVHTTHRVHHFKNDDWGTQLLRDALEKLLT